MSPELIGILGVGIGLLTAMIAMAATGVVLINQSEKRTAAQIEQLRADTNRRFDQMQEDMNRRFDQAQAENNRRFDQIQERLDAQDERIRGLELGQAHLAGQFDILKDYFMHQTDQG